MNEYSGVNESIKYLPPWRFPQYKHLQQNGNSAQLPRHLKHIKHIDHKLIQEC
jgi:hypothetical protein